MVVDDLIGLETREADGLEESQEHRADVVDKGGNVHQYEERD